MKKSFLYVIGAVFLVSISAFVIFFFNRDGEEDLALNKSKEYLKDPDSYMNDLKEKYDGEEQKTEHDHDHEELSEDKLAFYEKQKAKYLQEEKLVLTEKNYVVLMNLIDKYPSEFEGKKIELTGFIYREPGFMENQFVIGRREDPCCTEEPEAIYGILSTVLNADQFPADQWVKASGELTKTTYLMSEVPFLLVESIEKIEAPKNPFVTE